MENEKDCQVCNKAINKYNFYAHTKKYHNLNKKQYLDIYNPGWDVIELKKCVICEDLMKPRKNGVACSPKCSRKYQLQQISKKVAEKNKNDSSAIECQICGFKARQLHHHIKKQHNLSITEYREKYKVNVFSKSNLKSRSENVKGAKNPGFQHNGKFSPLSDKFLYKNRINKEEVKKKIGKSNKENGNNKRTLIYWLKESNGDKNLAKQKLKEHQTNFSLSICIEKLGEVEGKKKWLQRQEKWQKTMNSKPHEEIERINRVKMSKGRGYSKISQELFEEVYYFMKNNSNVYFATLKNQLIEDDGNNNEYCVFTKKGIRFLDFYDKKTNKLIEFDGDYWHGVRGNVKRDKEREEDIIDVIKCQILRIKECDYNNNPQKVIKECLEFLKS